MQYQIIPYLKTLLQYLFRLHQVETVSAGVKINRRRHNYKGAIGVRQRVRARMDQKFEKKISKKSHSAENCRTVSKIPYSISLYIEPNYTLSLYIEPNCTLS